MWRRASLKSTWCFRRSFTSSQRPIKDEGDWFYSSEWWGLASEGDTIFRSTSDKGNGVVSVVAHPSSLPEQVNWARTEKWLQQRYTDLHPNSGNKEQFKILGYQWRSLRFNNDTRQSTVKVMGTSRESDLGSVSFMQQPHCLAVPYLKSMVSAGLTTLASSNYDLENAVNGKKNMRILCIGHGGGSLPLFLASKIQGAVIDIVEIDPLVISASVQAMGFPSFSVMTPSGNKRAQSKPAFMDDILWRGIHERLFLYEADAEKFIIKTTDSDANLYDMVFIDAYDGDDIFPKKLWDLDSLFLKKLNDHLNPEHGTVVVNLHSDADILNPDGSTPSLLQQVLPMGKYVSGVCRAYKDVLAPDGFGFTVSVPWLCNVSLVVCKRFRVQHDRRGILTRDFALNTLVYNSCKVEKYFNFPFSFLEYLKTGFLLLD